MDGQNLNTDNTFKTYFKEGIKKKEKKKKEYKPRNTFQLEVFKELWNERKHVSEVSGKPLMFDVQCFHHILTKQAYPKFLLFKPNIILLTRDEHRQIHAFSFEDLIKKDSRWSMVQERYQKLKEMYNNG